MCAKLAISKEPLFCRGVLQLLRQERPAFALEVELEVPPDEGPQEPLDEAVERTEADEGDVDAVHLFHLKVWNDNNKALCLKCDT